MAGRAIDVSFDSGAVKRVTVRDDSLATGLYLEPETPDTTRRAARASATGPAARTGGPAGAEIRASFRRLPRRRTSSPAGTTASPAVPPRRP